MILVKQVHYKIIHHLCHGFHNSSKYTITNKVENGCETLSKNSPKNNLEPLEYENFQRIGYSLQEKTLNGLMGLKKYLCNFYKKNL